MTPTAREHPLHQSIAGHNIRRVAVVDDAFDAVSLASLQEGEGKEFVAAVNEDDALLREFHKRVSDADSDAAIRLADLTDPAVSALWQSRKAGGLLGPVLASTLFRVLGPKVDEVEALRAFLKNVLKIETVETFGTTSGRPTGEFDMAFVDYRFGPSGQDESVDRSVRWATHLYHNGRTFIVLMSAEPEARTRQEIFRAESKLTRGLFEFVDKAEIGDQGKLCNRLNSFCAGLGTRHAIHQFATAAEQAADRAAAAVKQSIHALGLEDYAYLDQISLREDGNPLGDYMLWLFGEYFANKISTDDTLQPARQSVNGLKYERLLPLQRPPSVMLAEMYRAAITEPVHEGWGPHPRSTQPDADGPATASERVVITQLPDSDDLAVSQALLSPPVAAASDEPAGMPLFQLGDLLVATKRDPVYLVCNAACDLQFSPGARDCDVEQSVILIPGRFEPLHERSSDTGSAAKRTELFELGGDRFRIIWQHTRARAHPFREVRDLYEGKGYTRKWRLKLAYALEVQQHFAAQLTRVGVPTPTPVFRERPVEVYGKGADGSYRSLGTVGDGVIVFHHRKRDRFVLTVDCVHGVLGRIDAFITVVEDEVRQAAETLAATATGSAAEAARPAISDAPATMGGAPAKKGKGKADAADQAAEKVKRRKKYLIELREARAALAYTCTFQNELHDLPALGASPLSQIDVFSENDKRTRLEVYHAGTLSGRFAGNAPFVIAFTVPDAVSTENSSATPPAGPDEPPAGVGTTEDARP